MVMALAGDQDTLRCDRRRCRAEVDVRPTEVPRHTPRRDGMRLTGPQASGCHAPGAFRAIRTRARSRGWLRLRPAARVERHADYRLCELHMSGFDDLVAAVFVPARNEALVTEVFIGATRSMVNDDDADTVIVISRIVFRWGSDPARWYGRCLVAGLPALMPLFVLTSISFRSSRTSASLPDARPLRQSRPPLPPGWLVVGRACGFKTNALTGTAQGEARVPQFPFSNATEAEGQQGIGDTKRAAKVDPGVVGHLRGPPSAGHRHGVHGLKGRKRATKVGRRTST